MLRVFYSLTLASTVLVGVGDGQERLTVGDDKDVLHGLFVTSLTPWASQEDFHRARFTSQTTDVVDAGTFTSLESPSSLSGQPIRTSLNQPVIRGQSPSGAGGGGGGASAADATDPSAILTQFQIQNVFTPETYDASGYSNTVILQPVLPFPVAMPGLKDIFPNHIIRPTLPIISPTADPDGPLGVEGGLGDLTLLDAFVHPVEGFGNLLFGYTAIFPTATDEQLGLQEWQLGPSAAVVYKEIPQTLLGVVYQQPFSLESDAQQVLIQPVYIRQLPDEWYVGWGELNWIFNTENGDYNIPLNVRVGKIVKCGQQPLNIFVEPFYTPEGLRKGPAAEWGVKLNVTLLFPDVKFGPLCGPVWDCFDKKDLVN